MICLADNKFKNTNIYCTNILRCEMEASFNSCGTIPVVSTLSGCGRVAIFATHTLIDIAQAIYVLALHLFSSSSNTQLYTASVLVVHDLSNLVRGMVDLLKSLYPPNFFMTTRENLIDGVKLIN